MTPIDAGYNRRGLATCHDDRGAAASRQTRHSYDPAGQPLLGSPPSAAAPGLTASHSVSPGPSTAWSLQNRPEPAEDRNTGPECGSVPHSGSSGRDSPEAQPRAEWAERGTFRPPGHSAGAAECSAARMATLRAADGRPSRACSGRTPWPGTARRRRAGRSGGDAVRQARQWP
jgi:hypothetical protein